VADRVMQLGVYADVVDRAIACYQTVFGWSIAKVEGMDYWLFTTGEGEPGINAPPSVSRLDACWHPGTVWRTWYPGGGATTSPCLFCFAIHQREYPVLGGSRLLSSPIEGKNVRGLDRPKWHHLVCTACAIRFDLEPGVGSERDLRLP